jgi:predicted ArsR family transcriptional regulator
MKTRVADTSIEVYHSEIKGAHEETENKKVLAAISEMEPCTGRQISEKTGIENSAVARSLNNLKNRKRIEVYFSANCKITGRRAQHYKIKRDQNTQTKLSF